MAKIKFGKTKDKSIFELNYRTDGRSQTELTVGDQYDSSIRRVRIDDRSGLEVDFELLHAELEQLRAALREISDTSPARKKRVISDIEAATKAAKSRDGKKLRTYLESAGQWALDVATKIGVPLAVEALKAVIKS